MTTPAAPPGAPPPQPCHEDPALLDQWVPSPAEHAANERVIADLVAAAMPRSVEASTPFAAAVPLTRPRFYPPANRSAQWFEDDVDTTIDSFKRATVLHTTETSGWPGYQGSATAPNLTAKPDYAAKRLEWRHHFGLNRSARALKNQPGGVLTNTSNVLQTELVGTCARGGPGMFWPEAPDWALAELAKFLVWFRDTWGVSTASKVRWRDYPDSYGARNGVRLSGSAWLAYRGILAHEHVPENDHGDCGRFPITRLQAAIAAADGGDDMPLTKAEKDEIVQRTVAGVAAGVWNREWREYYDRDHDGVRDDQTAADALVGGFAAAAQARDGIDAVGKRVDGLLAEAQRTNDLLEQLLGRLPQP